MAGMPPPPPPPPPPGGTTFSSPNSALPQFAVPRPRSRMKTFQWQKIPANNVIGKANIWTIIGHLDSKYEMDYERMDELFSLAHESGSKRSSPSIDGVPENKKKRENAEGLESYKTGQINILDGKRSLNVNIFLKQFRLEHEEIVQLLRDGRCEKIGAERLKALLKLLPSQEEIDAMTTFDGDRDKLGTAEKFFICLMKLPNYRMRTEGLLIMEEFNINMEWIRPSIEAVIQAARDIQENQSLKELVYLILISGNYLNSGNYAGNAAGFKLSSLLQLTEIRANKPGMNLMHYVAQEAQENNPRLLRFPEEMKFLKDASQVSVETLATDINNIASKVRAITEQITVAGKDFQQQMAFFLKEANREIDELEEDLNDIEMIRMELATFFCEDTKTFRLEECFRILQTFCERLRKATEENIQRRVQEAKAENRRMSREFEYRNSNVHESGDSSTNHKTDGDLDSYLVKNLLADVRNGFASRKFNDGNFSVTRVAKVSLGSVNGSGSGLDEVDGSPNQHKKSGGSPLSVSYSLSVRQKRRSNASMDDQLLAELLKGNSETSEPEKPEAKFERYASLRRRRLERKGRRNLLDVYETGRERASSPNLTDMSGLSSSTDSLISGVRMRRSRNSGLSGDLRERPKSGVDCDKKESQMLRRSRSCLDNSELGNADEQRRINNDDSTDESDALIRRLRQRLSSRRSGSYTPPIAEEGSESRKDNTSSPTGSTSAARNNSRWRNGIAVSETNSPLVPINENNLILEDVTAADLSKIQENISDRLTSNVNNMKEVNKTVQNNETDCVSENKINGSGAPNIKYSIRKNISCEMGTDIDGVLKTIEDTGRPIDMVGVTGPMKRSPEPTSNTASPQSQVAVVAHVTASNIPSEPIKQQEQKVKQESNTNKVTDDTKAPVKKTDSKKNSKVVNGSNNSLNRSRGSSFVKKTVPRVKTPEPNVRLCKSDERRRLLLSGDSGKKEELNKAKLAGKKKFRDARFGSSGPQKNGRASSNIESNNVDQALKEIANQSNVNRSKSFDERAAKKAQEDEEFGGSSNTCGSSSSSGALNLPGGISSENLQVGSESSTEQGRRNLDSTSYNDVFEDESDSPLAAMAKWKMKRVQHRRSVYDNCDISEAGNHLSIHDLENDSRSWAKSVTNDGDEGFETASGTMSQRTSMNSTLEAEINNNPALARLAGNLPNNGVEKLLSPDSGHSTSKEDDGSSVSSKTKQIDVQKTTSSDGASKCNKPKTVPSYMLPTSSSSSRPARASSTNNLDSISSSSNMKRSTPGRTSIRNQEGATVIKRDSARASMRAESANPSFQRGTVARTSVRGPRSSVRQSIDSPKTHLAPPSLGRSISASNTSVSSVTSSSSNVSTAHSVATEASRRLGPTSNSRSMSNLTVPSSGRPTTPSGHPTTPSGHPTTPSSRPITPASHTRTPSTKPAANSQTKVTSSAGGSFGRTQSMRVASSRSSLSTDQKRGTSTSTTDTNRSVSPLPYNGKRSATPLIFESNRSTTPLPERPHSTTPFSSERKTSRTSSFMAPTASSKAKADELTTGSSSISRSSSLRVLNKGSASGRKSPAITESALRKQEHYQSLSTVAEQAGDEDETPKKSSSIFKKLSIRKVKVSPPGTKTVIRNGSIISRK